MAAAQVAADGTAERSSTAKKVLGSELYYACQGSSTSASSVAALARRVKPGEAVDWEWRNPRTGESALEAVVRRSGPEHAAAILLPPAGGAHPAPPPPWAGPAPRETFLASVLASPALLRQRVLADPRVAAEPERCLRWRGAASNFQSAFRRAVGSGASHAVRLLLRAHGGRCADRNEGTWDGAGAVAVHAANVETLKELLDDGWPDEPVGGPEAERRLGDERVRGFPGQNAHSASGSSSAAPAAEAAAAAARAEDDDDSEDDDGDGDDDEDDEDDDDDALFAGGRADRSELGCLPQGVRHLRLAVLPVSPDTRTVLHTAVRLGSTSLVDRIVARGADIHAKPSVLHELYQYVSRTGTQQEAMLRHLLELGVDPNVLDSNNRTVGHLLARTLNPSVLPAIGLLLEAGMVVEQEPGMQSLSETARANLPYRYEDPWSDEEDPEMDFIADLSALEQDMARRRPLVKRANPQ